MPYASSGSLQTSAALPSSDRKLMRRTSVLVNCANVLPPLGSGRESVAGHSVHAQAPSGSFDDFFQRTQQGHRPGQVIQGLPGVRPLLRACVSHWTEVAVPAGSERHPAGVEDAILGGLGELDACQDSIIPAVFGCLLDHGTQLHPVNIVEPGASLGQAESVAVEVELVVSLLR